MLLDQPKLNELLDFMMTRYKPDALFCFLDNDLNELTAYGRYNESLPVVRSGRAVWMKVVPAYKDDFSEVLVDLAIPSDLIKGYNVTFSWI